MSGGNQLILTSRIAGYHNSPLRSKEVTRLFVKPMGPEAIRTYCESWSKATQSTNPKEESIALFGAIFDN